MEFRQLKHFVAVAEARNFTRAAKDAFISQPALTRSIQNLEGELGLLLFERTPSGLELTNEGLELLPRARKILIEWSRAKLDLSAMLESSEGALKLGVSAIFTRGMMGAVLDRFITDHPGAVVFVMEGSFVDLRRALLEGNYDILLTAEPLAADFDDARLNFTPLVNLEAAILASPQHSVMQAEAIDFAKLGNEKWIFFDRSAESTNVHLQENGIDLSHISVRSNSISLIISLLKTGNYLTVISPQVCSDEIARGDLVVVAPLPRLADRRIGLYVLNNRDLRPIEKSLIAHLDRAFLLAG